MPRAESDPDPSGHDAVSEMHLAVPGCLIPHLCFPCMPSLGSKRQI